MLFICRVFGIMLAIAFFATASAADTESEIRGCESCHGDGGASVHAPIPVIGGMSAFYLEEQMLAYQEGRRPCDEVEYPEGPRKGEAGNMCEEAAGLTPQQITEMADYFSQKPFVVPEQSHDQALAKKGKKLHEQHCSKCHSEGGGLAFDDAGILAGQWRGYLLDTLEAFRADKRWMPEKMITKIENLSDADVKALVEFYVSQEPLE